MHRREFIASLIKASGTAVFLGLVPGGISDALADDDNVIDSFRSSPDRLHDLLEIVMAGNADFADIFLEQVISRRYTVTNGVLTDSSFFLWEGIGIRGIHNARTVFAAADGFAMDTARDAARDVRRRINAPGNPREVKPMPKYPSRDYGAILTRTKLSRTGDTDVVNALLAIQKKTPVSSNLIQSMELKYTDCIRRIIVANSDGRYIMDPQPGIDLQFAHSARVQSNETTAFRRMSHRCGFEFLENPSVLTAQYETTADAVEQLSSKPVPAGNWPVALEPRAATAVTETWLKTLLLRNPAPGTAVAPEHLRLIDNGRIQNTWASGHFDDEGITTGESILVQNRQMVRRLNNGETAKQRQEPPTGNGRRADYHHLPHICPTNCYMESKLAEAEPAIESMAQGLLVRAMRPLSAGNEYSDSAFLVTSGWWIQNGIRAWPVHNVIIHAPFAALLNTIDRIGTDIIFEPAEFGDPPIPCAFGAPAMRIAGMTVRQMG